MRKKTRGTNKLIQQGHRMQDQHIKIYYTTIYWQQKKWKPKPKTQTIYNCSKENKIQLLGINLTKHIQNLHDDNHKMLIKDLNSWRNILCSWVRNFNIVKMSILPHLVYSLTQFLSKS